LDHNFSILTSLFTAEAQRTQRKAWNRLEKLNHDGAQRKNNKEHKGDGDIHDIHGFFPLVLCASAVKVGEMR
jgi:hypothetical protein